MKGVLSGLILGLLVAVAFAYVTKVPPPPPPDPVARGKFLVSIGGCDDCHSPKKMTEQGPVVDQARRLSGSSESFPPAPALAPGSPWMATTTWDLTAWSGPWGVSRGINLTPDEETGLGVWTETAFVSAMRSGKHMGVGRPILPPMPWQAFGTLPDEDLKAIFAFLRTLPPVKNAVRPPDPPN
jgi:hypothetical protein